MDEQAMSFALTSSGFADRGIIPAKFTCDGANLSPGLDWHNAPPGTRSFVLIAEDPDAPSGTFTHWVLYDIPAAVSSLAEGQKPGWTGHSGLNDFGRVGYGGPCPPRGHGPHRYVFTLSAMNVETLGLVEGASRVQVEVRMRSHVVATTKLMGKYERKK
jgi:Raf kinase inhibitor-like YbhB/YbcL family protein